VLCGCCVGVTWVLCVWVSRGGAAVCNGPLSAEQRGHLGFKATVVAVRAALLSSEQQKHTKIIIHGTKE